jgi:HAD superfamily hydrolase (TIGR01549 family)
MENESAFKTWFDRKKAVVFDLDGTIYEEWDYLSAAYEVIGKDLERQFGIAHSRIYHFLKEEFLTNGRYGLFNRLIDTFGLPEHYMPEALSILRNVKVTEKFICYPEITKCLEWLISRGKKIFIVTNGNTIQQKNKISSIEFGGLLDHIDVIYANEIVPKPDPKIIFQLQEKYQFSQEEIMMIGDSLIDESFASEAGIDFIHVNKIINLP